MSSLQLTQGDPLKYPPGLLAHLSQLHARCSLHGNLSGTS